MELKNKNVGLRFNRLTVIRHISGEEYECQCDCGNIINSTLWRLQSGNTKSCGCYFKEKVGSWSKKHGLAKHPLYKTWHNMRSRCKNPNATRYKYYGGRGISVCVEWDNDFLSFYNWSILNGWAKGLSIDRIDSNGNYEPNNCRWVTCKCQNNNLRSNHNITYNNETHSIYDWAERLQINPKTLSERIRRGWSIERAFTGGDCK